jgi:hypothetical protein
MYIYMGGGGGGGGHSKIHEMELTYLVSIDDIKPFSLLHTSQVVPQECF